MTPTVADLAALLQTSSAPKLKGATSVWRLQGSDRHAQDLRESFLHLAVRFPSVFAHYDGGQPTEASLTTAVQLAPNVWRLPPTSTGQALSAWLYMGNWQLYARSEPLTELRDLCRAYDAGVNNFVREAGVSFIVDSFHDSTEWTIALRAEGNDA